jgi:hypothetical protein
VKYLKVEEGGGGAITRIIAMFATLHRFNYSLKTEQKDTYIYLILIQKSVQE